jgi:hypothetical protein
MHGAKVKKMFYIGYVIGHKIFIFVDRIPTAAKRNTVNIYCHSTVHNRISAVFKSQHTFMQYK